MTYDTSYVTMRFFKSSNERASLSVNYINEVGDSMALYVFKGGSSKHIALLNVDKGTTEWSI